MAHSPEQPDLYVCTECQVAHAGTVAEYIESGGHSYEPPEACGACGASSFVESSGWPHVGK
ncbi:hypothetical protein [Halobellus clavatus]|jgi:hypothetical protein|uniref:Small CPxCG-related zinc finger protein n=1 Tax=Halobellus clavatus TaxID=660517 RepID=A0A1H3KB35_9EURY|nr:hypothetical protein [Halobellus clavatus]SDY49323.1 hypothetical protein SAMN04487946_11834 [Halobellus clavatus]